MDDGDHVFPDPGGGAGPSVGGGPGVPRLAAVLRRLDPPHVGGRLAPAVRPFAVQSHVDVDRVPEPRARDGGRFLHSRNRRLCVAAPSARAAHSLDRDCGVALDGVSGVAGWAGRRPRAGRVDRHGAHDRRARDRADVAVCDGRRVSTRHPSTRAPEHPSTRAPEHPST